MDSLARVTAPIIDPEIPVDRLTDLGNAERLVFSHGDSFRHVGELGFLVWDGRRWEVDRKGAVQELAKESALELMVAASAYEDDLRARVQKHAIKAQSHRSIRDAISLAKSDPKIVATPEEFDQDRWNITLENGTYDLKGDRLLAHDRRFMSTKLSPVEYDDGAECPLFLAFLDRIFDGQSDLIGFVQRAMGYTLTGSVDEQVLFLCHGGGANGKSTFLEVVRAILGDYASQAKFETFLTQRQPTDHRNDLAGLRGSRFVGVSESRHRANLDEATVKQVTGGEAIRCRFLNKEFFEFYPEFKLWLATNHLPGIKGTDEGIWRRVRKIPFEVTIPKEERDRDLPTNLRRELPGILNWMLEGLRSWREGGLQEPRAVVEATQEYQTDQDQAGRFLRDETELPTRRLVR